MSTIKIGLERNVYNYLNLSAARISTEFLFLFSWRVGALAAGDSTVKTCHLQQAAAVIHQHPPFLLHKRENCSNSLDPKKDQISRTAWLVNQSGCVITLTQDDSWGFLWITDGQQKTTTDSKVLRGILEIPGKVVKLTVHRLEGVWKEGGRGVFLCGHSPAVHFLSTLMRELYWGKFCSPTHPQWVVAITHAPPNIPSGYYPCVPHLQHPLHPTFPLFHFIFPFLKLLLPETRAL